MKTVFEVTSADGRPVFNRFSGLHHRPRSTAQSGHHIVFDDVNRTLSFHDSDKGETGGALTDSVSLTSDLDVDTAKDYLAGEVAGKRLEALEPPAKASPKAAKADLPKTEPVTPAAQSSPPGAPPPPAK